MSDERYRDFDQFSAEQQGEPVRFTVRGQTFELPPSMPAKTMLTGLRLRKEHGDEADVPAEELWGLAEGLFGSELERLLNTGVGVEQLGEIIGWVMQQYGPSGNPPAREETAEASTSSSTGD